MEPFRGGVLALAGVKNRRIGIMVNVNTGLGLLFDLFRPT
jgi:hypothetical protein